jgi:hypothetical protein
MSLLAVGSVASGTGTSISTNAPSGVAAGDRLLLAVAVKTKLQADTPSGWTLTHYVESGTNTVGLTVFRRVADGTAADTPTVALSSSLDYTAIICRLSAGAFDVGNTTLSAFASSLALPTATVAANGSFGLYLAAHSSASAQVFTWPSGWTKHSDNFGSGGTIGVAHRTLDAGTSPSGTVSSGTSARLLASLSAYGPVPPSGPTYASHFSGGCAVAGQAPPHYSF